MSWGAITAGVAVALIVGAMLNALGAGIGAAMIDTTARTPPDAQAFSLTTALWLACASAIGLVAGGYVAARLLRVRDRTVGLLHGAGVWAAAFLVAVVLAGSAASGASLALLRGAGSVAASAAGGLAGAGADASDALLERLGTTTLAPVDAAATPRDAAVAEAGQLIAARAQGEWTVAQRQRLEALVASVASVPQPVAADRVAQAKRALQDAARRTEQAARTAADAAAAAASGAALAAFATMLLGLVAALVGAAAGHRAPLPGADGHVTTA